MKPGIIFSIAALSVFAFVVATAYLAAGCKKTNSPLGVYAPLGADVPTPSPTPVQGNFDIYVLDNTIPVSGVTVFLVDPFGNTETPEITQNVVGYAAFNVPNISNGVWTAGVSQQGIFGFSEMPITVTDNSAGNYYFSAPYQSVSVWNISPLENYNYQVGEQLAYGVSYVQPGNLNEPVSMSNNVIGVFPAAWGVTFYPQVLGTGNGVNSGTVTVTVPVGNCTDEQPIFSFEATKLNNVQFFSSPLTITKNFISTMKLLWLNSPVSFTSDILLNLTTTNDCTNTWNVQWHFSDLNDNLSGNNTFSSGQSIVIKSSHFNAGTISVGVTVSGQGFSFPFSGTAPAAAGAVTLINTNF